MTHQSELQACTVYRLRLAARRASRLYDRHLAPAGIGVAQFALLRVLEIHNGSSVTALALALEMDRTTLTRNLRPLVRAGLVELMNGSDRRSRAIEITSEGRDRLAMAHPLWQQAQGELRDSLGPSHHD